MLKVIIAWGEENAQIINELSQEEYKVWMLEHVGESGVVSYEFKTKDEVSAFLKGVYESQGWFTFNSLTI